MFKKIYCTYIHDDPHIKSLSIMEVFCSHFLTTSSDMCHIFLHHCSTTIIFLQHNSSFHRSDSFVSPKSTHCSLSLLFSPLFIVVFIFYSFSLPYFFPFLLILFIHFHHLHFFVSMCHKHHHHPSLASSLAPTYLLASSLTSSLAPT